ncbi:MAG: hypothetical protein U9Q91_05835 [Candidatus Marinimicrobia bacterium]|nr:hypothetical protein [Candidatus Neomarinimicrobiota bacterium]
MMKRILPIFLMFLLLFSCSIPAGDRTYKLKNAPFPHQDRADGYMRKGIHYSFEEHYADSSVGVVIPLDYKKKNKVDLLIHFHGWGNSVDTCIVKFDLDEQLIESEKNILLVVPEGPKFAPDSFNGKLCDEGGFARFIDELLDSLKTDKIIRTKKIGRIILSGHSGGYYVMAHILRYGGCTEYISDVFIFDGLYRYENDYLNWLLNYKGRLVNIYTQNGGTLDNTESFMAKCDSASIPYFKGDSKDIEVMPDDRVLMLFSDLGHSDVMHKRSNLLKILESMK